jgi:hypothetical protein
VVVAAVPAWLSHQFAALLLMKGCSVLRCPAKSTSPTAVKCLANMLSPP